MKPLLVILVLLVPGLARADGFILGAGRWYCEELLQAIETQDMTRVFQAVGWLLGYWSAETRHRDRRFVDIVEQVGGEAIYAQTLAECREAPAETRLYQIADGMIRNTR